MREQEVIAWSTHDTAGLFESVAVIPNPTLGINEVWFVVNRDGTRFIERMVPRDMGPDVQDYMMLDCAITQDDRSLSLNGSGANHLAGRTVSALVRGAVLNNLAIANDGTFTLPVPCEGPLHIGIPYVSDVETLRIDIPTATGTAQGKRIAIPEVTIRFLDSSGGYIKAMSQELDPPAITGVAGFDEVLQHDANQDMTENNMAHAAPLKTMDYKHTMNGGYDFGAHLFFRQVDPLPFTIIGLFPKIVVSDN
jgi:hypothetical protein